MGFYLKNEKKILNYFEKCLSFFGQTHIFFESPHRLEKTIKILEKGFPYSEIAICRELTKKFETIHRFKAIEFPEQNIKYKGEFVFLVNFMKKKEIELSQRELIDLAHSYLEKKSPKKLAKNIK